MAAPKLTSPDSILVTQKMPAVQVIEQAYIGVRHLIQKDGVAFQQEQKLAEVMISSPKKFFLDPLREIICGPAEAEKLFRFTCKAEESKRGMLVQLREFLEQFNRTKSVRDEVLLAADEIFTNASKNTGVFYSKESSGVTRPGVIEFTAYIDTERVVILCTDSYGGLEIPSLVGKIRHVYETGIAGAIQHGDAGAGIGSFLIFNNCSSYYLGVDKNKKTVVGGAFQHTPRSPDKAALSKHFNFVSIE
jgi:hypothetical protein